MTTLVFGDSLASALSPDALRPEAWTISAHPGETTFELKKLLDQEQDLTQYNRIIIMCGQNDAGQGLAIVETVENLVDMVNVASKVAQAIDLVVPRCEQKRKAVLVELLLDKVDLLDDSDIDIDILDPWQELDQDEANWQADGIHLSSQGAERLLEGLK